MEELLKEKKVLDLKIKNLLLDFLLVTGVPVDSIGIDYTFVNDNRKPKSLADLRVNSRIVIK